jgi:hypothetical protein
MCCDRWTPRCGELRGRDIAAAVAGAPRIALLWHQAEDETKARRVRLDGVFRALSARGATPEPVVYADEIVEATRDALLRVDGVLVWVNPITAGKDRSILDALLREVAGAGVWVSAHPDVVSTFATKEVLHHTRALGWGSDVRTYGDIETLTRALPARLESGPIVLKRARGNGGLGVWKVELQHSAARAGASSIVRIEHAHDAATELISLSTFLEGFAGYFEGGGRLVEQPFLERVGDGMVRAYVAGETVAGFAEHLPRGLLPASPASTRRPPGLGHEKQMHGPDAARFASLRVALETDWIPGMQRLLGLSRKALPAIWDADFLRGSEPGDDRWVLCEINASCVSPFPEVAADLIARTTLERVLREVA